MKEFKISVLINNQDRVFSVRRHYKDGLALSKQEALRLYILPHLHKAGLNRPTIENITIEEVDAER